MFSFSQTEAFKQKKTS